MAARPMLPARPEGHGEVSSAAGAPPSTVPEKRRTTMTAPMTTPLPADRKTRRGRRRLAVLGLAALVGLVTWAVAVPLLGVPLAARTGPSVTVIGPVSGAVAAVVVGGAAWPALALLGRASRSAPRG